MDDAADAGATHDAAGAVARGRATGAVHIGDLPEPWRRDPYLLGEHAHAEVLGWWAGDGGLVAVVDGRGRGCGLIGLGEPAAVARQCARAVADRPDAVARTARATLPRGTFELLTPEVAAGLGYRSPGSAWDWMWTDRPLRADAGPAERLPLGPRTHVQVAELLSRAHPTAGTAPDDDRLVGWWAVRHEGRLVAAVGALLPAPGLPPHLVSLGVDPAARGRGLAGAVLAAAVRDGLRIEPSSGPRMVSLGLYEHNHVARRVYLRLGLRLSHRFATRRRAA